jgi:hypothetical protein
MYTLIENFCLGFRRLEIFGRPSSLRRGWVTVLSQGQEERLPPAVDGLGTIHVEGEEGGRATRWERETWEDGVKELSNGGKPVVPMTPEIDALRPKSPFRPNQNQNNGGGSMGPGGGNRFGNRPGFGAGVQGAQGQVHQQNQMMVQPMMGMGMNALGMGMGAGVGVDDMMGQWNPMMGMGNMNVGGMGGMNVGGMGGMANAGLANVGRMGMPMMGHMGMGGGFGTGGGVFNPAMGGAGMGWTEQGQFGLEGGWDGENMMNPGVNGMGGAMNMNQMNMTGGMGMGQWTGPSWDI